MQRRCLVERLFHRRDCLLALRENSSVVFSSFDLVFGVREKFVRVSGGVDAKCVKGMNSRAVAKKRVSKVGFLFER